MNIVIRNFQNQEISELNLNPDIFGLPLRIDILARVVRWQLANRRAGTHKTKGISDISGTTRKPYRQKGTGRARHGSLRSPQFRGGATIFGPVVRDHEIGLPKKVRKLALRVALSNKFSEKSLIVLNNFSIPSGKSKDFIAGVRALGLQSALMIGEERLDSAFMRSAMNVPGFDVLPRQGINVYDILRRPVLVLTQGAIEYLGDYLK